MKTIYKQFKEWFDKYAFTHDLLGNLDKWQLHRIEDACWRAFKNGRKSNKKRLT